MRPSKLHCASLAILGLALAGPAWAESYRFDLSQAIDAALARNPKMAAAAAKVATKEWELLAAKKEMNPTVSLDIKTQFGHGDSTSFFALQGPGDPDENAVTANGPYASAALSLALPLYEKGSWRHQESAQQAQAAARYDKSKLESETDTLTLVNQVFKDYLGVQESLETIQRYQEVLDNKRKTLDLVKKKVAARVAPGSDLYRLEADIAAARGELKAAERKRDRGLNQLRLDLGLARGDAVELLPLPALPESVPDFDALLNEALANHPDLRIKASEVHLSDAQLREVQNEQSPVLALNAAMNAANDLQGSSLHAFYSVGVSLSMPLLDFGKNTAQANAQAAMLKENQQNLLLAQSELIAKVQEAHDAWLNALDDVQTAGIDLEQAQAQARDTGKLLQARASTLDLLAAEEGEVLNRRIKLIEVRYKAWSAYADLLKTTGSSRLSLPGSRTAP